MTGVTKKATLSSGGSNGSRRSSRQQMTGPPGPGCWVHTHTARETHLQLAPLGGHLGCPLGASPTNLPASLERHFLPRQQCGIGADRHSWQAGLGTA